jgi:hypothetical protein
MKSRFPVLAVLTVFFSMLASFSQAARQDAPEVTPGGLHLVPDTRLGLVYADPEADLSGYSRILLMDAQVAFRKDWQRDINQARPFNVTNEDMERIKTSVADMFREIFSEALTSGGGIKGLGHRRHPHQGHGFPVRPDQRDTIHDGPHPE